MPCVLRNFLGTEDTIFMHMNKDKLVFISDVGVNTGHYGGHCSDGLLLRE